MFTNWNDLENKVEHFEIPVNGVNATKQFLSRYSFVKTHLKKLHFKLSKK